MQCARKAVIECVRTCLDRHFWGSDTSVLGRYLGGIGTGLRLLHVNAATPCNFPDSPDWPCNNLVWPCTDPVLVKQRQVRADRARTGQVQRCSLCITYLHTCRACGSCNTQPYCTDPCAWKPSRNWLVRTRAPRTPSSLRATVTQEWLHAARMWAAMTGSTDTGHGSTDTGHGRLIMWSRAADMCTPTGTRRRRVHAHGGGRQPGACLRCCAQDRTPPRHRPQRPDAAPTQAPHELSETRTARACMA